MNPGFSPGFRCLREQALCLDFDAFLDRAEAFGLTEKEAARIWNARNHRRALRACPHNRLEELSGAGLDCVWLLEGACLLSMPRCEGVCPHFER